MSGKIIDFMLAERSAVDRQIITLGALDLPRFENVVGPHTIFLIVHVLSVLRPLQVLHIFYLMVSSTDSVHRVLTLSAVYLCGMT